MVSRQDPAFLTSMIKWSEALNKNVDWINVFTNLFYTLTNNFKLIQFHYKLWHRISTCRYMRHKMNIDRESALCSLCSEEIETLHHIFLNCELTRIFIGQVSHLISSKVDQNYMDVDGYFRITLSHTDQRVNFVNAVANWYISRKFQNKSPLIFEIFVKELRIFLFSLG